MQPAQFVPFFIFSILILLMLVGVLTSRGPYRTHRRVRNNYYVPRRLKFYEDER